MLSSLPRSITKPASPLGVPLVPVASSISLSLIVVFVDDTVVVLPFIVRSPATITLLSNVLFPPIFCADDKSTNSATPLHGVAPPRYIALLADT